MEDLRTAICFLTRLPFGAERAPGLAALAGSVHMFPIAGALVGLIGGAAFALATFVGLPTLPAALIAIAALVAVTGGLHEDGLADTFDGLGGGHDAEQRLSIMRDSRIGTFGVIALLLTLLARISALATLWDPIFVASVLVASAAASRATLPAVMLLQDPARADGLGAGTGRPTSLRVMTAVAAGVLIALACVPLVTAIVALTALIAAAFVTSWWCQARIGGYTGDTLGAVQQVSEVAFLLGVIVVL